MFRDFEIKQNNELMSAEEINKILAEEEIVKCPCGRNEYAGNMIWKDGESQTALSLQMQYENTEKRLEQGHKRFLKELSNYNIRKEVEVSKFAR